MMEIAWGQLDSQMRQKWPTRQNQSFSTQWALQRVSSRYIWLQVSRRRHWWSPPTPHADSKSTSLVCLERFSMNYPRLVALGFEYLGSCENRASFFTVWSTWGGSSELKNQEPGNHAWCATLRGENPCGSPDSSRMSFCTQFEPCLAPSRKWRGNTQQINAGGGLPSQNIDWMHRHLMLVPYPHIPDLLPSHFTWNVG